MNALDRNNSAALPARPALPARGGPRSGLRRSLPFVAVLLTTAAAQVPAAEPRARPSQSDTVIGSGKVQTETRAIEGYRAIALRGAMNLVLRQGQHEGVQVRADHNLLPLIETRVVHAAGLPTLEIGMKGATSYSTRSEMTVTVDLIGLSALTIGGSGDTLCDSLKVDALKLALSGSGDLRLRQLTAQALDLSLSGSGNVEAAGRAARIDLAISGSGNAKLRGLDADDVSVRIAGSGDADVHARRALTVAIAGSGDVSYGGDPLLNSAGNGSGRVAKR